MIRLKREDLYVALFFAVIGFVTYIITG